MSSHAIRIHETGGPDVLKWEEVEVGDPGPGEVRIRHGAVGLNYIDVYFRTGLYPGPGLPFSIGMEGAGTVEAVGVGVTECQAGDLVAYPAAPVGAYAQVRNMPADRVVVVPDEISDEQAAAMMLKGMTVQYLLRSVHKVSPGETILFHAAAGGVGLIACQWAKALGAKVIGTVGSDEKAALAKAHGCDHPIVYTRDDFVEKVNEITNGAGVPVVYDSVGADTFMKSLDCLQPLGMMASFGQSSGKVEPFDPGILAAKGSLFLTRPTLMTYTHNRRDLEACANDLFGVVGSGKVKIEINNRYALKDAAQAHSDLEGRKTTGSTIFNP